MRHLPLTAYTRITYRYVVHGGVSFISIEAFAARASNDPRWLNTPLLERSVVTVVAELQTAMRKLVRPSDGAPRIGLEEN